DPTSMMTTYETLTLGDFATLVRPHLSSRRLFISACSMTNDTLAKAIIPKSGRYSLLGPAQDVAISDAAILWASLYHVFFANDPKSIDRAGLTTKAQEVATMFRVPLKLFVPSESVRKGYRSVPIEPEREAVVDDDEV